MRQFWFNWSWRSWGRRRRCKEWVRDISNNKLQLLPCFFSVQLFSARDCFWLRNYCSSWTQFKRNVATYLGLMKRKLRRLSNSFFLNHSVFGQVYFLEWPKYVRRLEFTCFQTKWTGLLKSPSFWSQGLDGEGESQQQGLEKWVQWGLQPTPWNLNPREINNALSCSKQGSTKKKQKQTKKTLLFLVKRCWNFNW